MENINIWNSDETYSYIKLLSKYYWLEKRVFFSPGVAWNNLMMNSKELNEARMEGKIKSYDWICYKKWWVP